MALTPHHTRRVAGPLLAGLAGLFTLALLPPGGREAGAEETKMGTLITALPTVITAPGVYVLQQDFGSLSLPGGAAITIASDDVTLDLNGHTLGNAAGPGTTALGVYAIDQRNVTVRHGRVRGFLVGVDLDSSGQTTASGGRAAYGNRIEDVHATGEWYAGVWVSGDDDVVRRVQVDHVGGTTIPLGGAAAVGVGVSGSGPRVLDSNVSDVGAQGVGVGFVQVSGGFAVGNQLNGAAGAGFRWDLASALTLNDNVVAADVGQAYEQAALSVARFNPALDPDGSGLPVAWEEAYFGTTGVDPNADPDGDGLTNLQEYQQGLNPTDFYNGQTPTMAVVSGTPQTGPPGGFVPLPLVVSVTDAGRNPYSGAPVTFSVGPGGGQVQASSIATPGNALTVLTDFNGQARVFFKLPNAASNTSQVTAATGSGSHRVAVPFTESSDGGGGSYRSPFDPTNVTATLNADGSLDVTWTTNADPADPDTIDIQDFDANGVYHTIATAPAGATSYHVPAP